MARTLSEIYKTIVAEYISRLDAEGIEHDDPDNWSATSVIRMIFATVAFFMFVMENLFDTHKEEVQQMIDEQRVPTLSWYKKMALNFQLGDTLVEGKDYYDNAGLTPEQIAAKRIIVNAAVTKNGRVIQVKVVKQFNGDYATLDVNERAALADYMDEVGPAGDSIEVVSRDGDNIITTIEVYYNPQILTSDGRRQDRTNDTPVQEAAQSFLKKLGFNGRYYISRHEEHIRNTDGVEVVKIISCMAKSATSPTYSLVQEWYPTLSGYLRYDDDSHLNITFIPFNE
jgi:hypothetical protein